MPPGSLVRMVLKNTVRSPRHFVLSAFGIVIGIAAFVFFLGLSMGVRNVLLGKIFPIERVSVVAPRAGTLTSALTGKSTTRTLDDETVRVIASRPEVKAAVPRMSLVFPAIGFGNFEGQELRFEVGGFADGIAPDFVAEDPILAEMFRDWEGETEGKRAACTPAPTNPCANPDLYYCDKADQTCHHRVPVIVSPTLLELFNGQFASSHKLPTIDQDIAKFIISRGGYGKMRFKIGLGDTMVAGTKGTTTERREVEGVLIGVNTKAMAIGMTMPIQYIRRWNQQFAGDEAARTYSSIVVTLRDKDRLAPFSQWLQDDLDLRLEDSLGEQFATAIFIVTTLFVLISFVIVGISAINIAHNFFMQVSERRREIGVLRAVGATRADVRVLILCEAALIGVLGGMIGVAVAWLSSLLVDWLSSQYLPRFPFKPDTYFDFQPWIILGGLAFSTLFCVLGGFLPAGRAAQMAPAQALAQN